MITSSTFTTRLVKKTVTEKFDAKGKVIERETTEEYERVPANNYQYTFPTYPQIISST